MKCHRRQMPQMPQPANATSHSKLLKMLSLQAGANSGGLKKWQLLHLSDCDSTKAGLQGQAGKSRQQLKPDATTGRQGRTKKAGRRQNDIEVAPRYCKPHSISFLRQEEVLAYQAARHLTLTIAGVQVCGICQLWTTEKPALFVANNKTEGLALIPLFPEQQEIILWQRKANCRKRFSRSEVQPCSPSIEYYPLDRQIVLKTEMI